MNTRSWYLIGMLVILFIANIGMLMGMTNWPIRERFSSGGVVDVPAIARNPVKGGLLKPATLEPFDDSKHFNALNIHVGSGAQSVDTGAPILKPTNPTVKALGLGAATPPPPPAEGFMDYLTAGFGTPSIGMYDGRNMAAGLMNPINQGFKKSTPNEPLAGPPVEVGPDNLFYFKNNQCKPECCGSTLACDGGCVCTTPEQRNFINTRGGNRTSGDI